MQQLAPTTELEAVNILLSTIGESPLSTLSASESMADVAIARAVLREVSIQVLEEAWQFNSEEGLTLQPSADTGEILVPETYIQVDLSGCSQMDVTLRGQRLYDRRNHTYVFGQPVKADVVILLPFEEMPQAARHYVTIRAARVFQQRTVGSQALDGYTQRDEMRARAALKKMDANVADYNILTGSWSVARVLAR